METFSVSSRMEKYLLWAKSLGSRLLETLLVKFNANSVFQTVAELKNKDYFEWLIKFLLVTKNKSWKCAW